MSRLPPPAMRPIVAYRRAEPGPPRGRDAPPARPAAARPADLAIDAVGIRHARIDGRRLDDRAFRGQVADREADGTRQAARLRPVRREDHLVRVHTVLFLQPRTQAGAAFGMLPFVQV